MNPGANHYAALAMAAVLCGCAGTEYDSSAWFSKPLDLFGSKGGYTYAQLDQQRRDRRITANDLVDANGACPTFAGQTQTPPPSGDTAQNPAGVPEAGPNFGGGVGVGMSECEVVSRVGRPNSVNLSRNQNGDRTAVMTFTSGPRPGVYRFVGGQLTEMDRVEEPQAPARPPKKKPAKNEKPAKTKDAT